MLDKMSNPTGKGGFQERPTDINRSGKRAKDFVSWRNLNKDTLNELATRWDKDKELFLPVLIKTLVTKNNKPVLDENGKYMFEEHYATNAEMITRTKMKNEKYQSDVIEAAYGKVPNPVELTGKDGGAVKINITIDNADV